VAGGLHVVHQRCEPPDFVEVRSLKKNCN
jgi:hypothetical protein